jgi:hypothetical protein
LTEDNQEAESNRHEEKIALTDYLDNEPLATYRGFNGNRTQSLAQLCDKYGEMPETLTPAQAQMASMGSKINYSVDNGRVSTAHCFDELHDKFKDRFNTDSDVIKEVERIAKAKKQLKRL